MATMLKLSAEERRAAIIQAVRRVFAEKGFDGTTTRELAEAAGVSEALLFKHFPTKEALYSAMMLTCYHEQDRGLAERLLALQPSASTLVVLVHVLMSRMLRPHTADDEDRMIQKRLMLRSVLADGEFARLVVQGLPWQWVRKVEASLRAAIAAGEAVEGPIRPNVRAWFAHHVGAMTMLLLLPEKPVVDYGVSREKLIEQAVWFALRGLGLKEETIRRDYNPKALALFTG
jgi:AcrR family transcriptional regulator